jgi:hypothetical protein
MINDEHCRALWWEVKLLKFSTTYCNSVIRVGTLDTQLPWVISAAAKNIMNATTCPKYEQNNSWY